MVGMELKEENERGELELMPSSLAKLLSRVFHECARDHDLMDCMKESVVSLIYKNKGVRHDACLKKGRVAAQNIVKRYSAGRRRVSK